MRKYKNKKSLIMSISKASCNKCGRKMMVNECNQTDGCYVKHLAGYGAKYFEDGDDIEFDICEECLFKFVKSFKIPATVTNYFKGLKDGR